jgi:putative transposase
MDLQRNTHHVYRLMYHFVWIPKYRHNVFEEPYRSELKAIINKIAYDYDIAIVELEVPTDHIDMVIRSEPKIFPSQVMQIIKSISAR